MKEMEAMEEIPMKELDMPMEKEVELDEAKIPDVPSE
jgi:hypothetical protein